MSKERTNNPRQLTRHAHRLMQEGRPDSARPLFMQALEQLPAVRPRARLRYRREESQLVVSRLKAATKPLSRTESLSLETRLALADCCIECGYIEEGVRHLERAVEACPDKAEAYCNLGLAYQKTGRQELAASALRRALKLNPAQSKAHHGLARHFVKKERITEAKRSLRKALACGSAPQECYLGLAACSLQQGATGEALDWLHKALAHSPKARLPREMLAETYQRMGAQEKVVEQAQALLEMNPRNPHALDLLAGAQFQLGELEGAAASLNCLIRLNPMDTFARLKLAMLYQQTGDLIRAMKEYQQVENLAGNDECAHTARAAIQNLDTYQMQQIVMRATEDIRFRTSLETDIESTLHVHGYCVSEEGLDMLRKLDLEAEISAEEWEVTYH